MLAKKKQKLKYILAFKEITINDIPIVGGKNASLGEMYRNLRKGREKINIPNGFAITAQAYKYFLEEAGVEKAIYKLLKKVNRTHIGKLQVIGEEVRQLILNAELPKDLEKEIIEAYRKLSKEYKNRFADVAVRSSATAEDLPTASFAGQQESYLNVKGDYQLLTTVKQCFASLFTDRAIAYRIDQGFKHADVALSVVVQKMVRSDLASSGVMFTIDTETGFDKSVLINASYGLGEYVVKGVVTPDEYFVFKTTLAKKFRPIINKKIGTKEHKLIYATGGNKSTADVLVSAEDRKKFVLTEDEIILLAKWGVKIEEYYGKPMDIEWGKDGKDGQLYILQARPETVKSQTDAAVVESYILEGKGKELCSGNSVGSKIGVGTAHLIKNVQELDSFQEGEILVTEMTDPDWEPVMKKASAIVTNSGGRTCHAAIVSRELGIPCLVGTKTATQNIKNQEKITVDCSGGEVGYVYHGILKYRIEKYHLDKLPKLPVKLMMNVAEPSSAFKHSFLPNDGIGLARLEFIINNHIKIHPLALLNYSKLNNDLKKEIDAASPAYSDKRQFFIDRLAQGVGQIAAAFYPKQVIVRLSDFKTNEYANLLGGTDYEPVENNPMIGWRGASRYYSKEFLPAFRMELEAMQKVIYDFGLDNIALMVPFCRALEEAEKVTDIMKRYQLDKKADFYMMCEIPSNVILVDEFSKYFDGFSIGTNDLTQLVLGVDRDSELVSHVYDERNPAVKRFVAEFIKKAHKKKKKVGICGQAPSDYPEFAEFLFENNIDSISLTPDSIMKTYDTLAKLKKRKKQKK